MKNRWIWIGVGALALLCWPLASIVSEQSASAQIAPPFSRPRLGGPLIYSFGGRPFTTFSGGQFGLGYFSPYMQNSYASQGQSGTVGYYLIPIDPASFYMGTFPNVPAVDPGSQTTTPSTGTYPIARTSDAFEAEYDKEGNLRIVWAGETTAARSVRFTLLNSKRLVLKEVEVTKLPAEAKFDRNEKASFVQAVVIYVNGTTNSMVCPLVRPAPPEAPKKATANGKG